MSDGERTAQVLEGEARGPDRLTWEEMFDFIETYQTIGDVIHLEDIRSINRTLEALFLYGVDPQQNLEEQVAFLSLCAHLNTQRFLSLGFDHLRSLFALLKFLREVQERSVTVLTESVQERAEEVVSDA